MRYQERNCVKNKIRHLTGQGKIHRLDFGLTKSKYLILGTKHSIKRIQDLNLVVMIDEHPIEQVSDARN